MLQGFPISFGGTEIAVPTSLCSIAETQLWETGGVAITTLLVLVLLFRSLTAFVKVLKS
ncbi:MULTISPECIES: hypothetical protein [Nostocales]|uniref:Uncharacterized protein n=3 Tax=Nostocales TaxID=1161 RepID=A0A8S9TD43_9CYAN|nr:hypothetical protein [Tolypothrix bouteillei]KAF3890116.1 hypothetical protein DA73_0400035165 [Tolypothrix bouteillei VB521301]